MKYVDEYRDATVAQRYIQAIKKITTRSWCLMEVCGGQTHAIVKFGIDQLLPDQITLLHGPGCPVCVTPIAIIDRALAIAQRSEVIFCSFGDMLRVPGTTQDLLAVKAHGGDVRIVYSPLDALKIAQANPDRQVVFFAVGFETTAPAHAMAVYQANILGLKNFSILPALVLLPPVLEALLQSPDRRVQGFLAAGHVCSIMGYAEYEPIAQKYHVPIIVTGFEPIDILEGIYLCIQQLETGQAQVENQYQRSVQRSGNRPAQQMLAEVFTIVPRTWRGLGTIAQSGFGLSPDYVNFDANRRFPENRPTPPTQSPCISGLVLQGIAKPDTCPAFGKQCTPDHPLGATMVSSEGACAAYYQYRALPV
jgi:hydrogenase expression/formation protein HypD